MGGKLEDPFKDDDETEEDELPDEYDNDDDSGFDTYLVTEENFVAHCK